MRTILIPAVLALVAAPLAPALAARKAPAPARASCPWGQLKQVRVSEILPDGSLAGFREALAEHARWYARNGYPQDRFILSEVVYESGTRLKRGRSGIRVMTVHSPMSEVPPEKQDDQWRAWVAKYKANSRIVSTMVTCESFATSRTAAAVSPRRWAR